MSIEFLCNHCASSLKTPDNSAGKRVKCPRCETIQTIPGVQQPPTAVSPAKPRIQPRPAATTSQPALSPKSIAPSPQAKSAHADARSPLESTAAPSGFNDFLDEELNAPPPAKAPKAPWEMETPAPEPTPSYDPPESKQVPSDTMLRPAAFCLILLSSLALVLFLFVICTVILPPICSPQPMNSTLSDPRKADIFAKAFWASFFGIFGNIAILHGGICMFRRKNYVAAKTGASMASLPFFNLLAVPFGIWAFSILSKEAVKKSFKANPKEYKGIRNIH